LILAGAPPKKPLVELTALPSWISGANFIPKGRGNRRPTSKGRG